MSAQSSVVLPNTLRQIAHESRYGRRVYTLAGAERYTDRALLEYCDYTPEFGGTVERLPNGDVRVSVYTD